MGIKCPYCGEEIPTAEFARHHAECKKRPKKIPVEEKIEEAEEPRFYLSYEVRPKAYYWVGAYKRLREASFAWRWRDDYHDRGEILLELPQEKGRRAASVRYLALTSSKEEGIKINEGRAEVDEEWAESFYNQLLEKLAKTHDETSEVKDLFIEKVTELVEKIDELKFMRTILERAP